MAAARTSRPPAPGYKPFRRSGSLSACVQLQGMPEPVQVSVASQNWHAEPGVLVAHVAWPLSQRCGLAVMTAPVTELRRMGASTPEPLMLAAGALVHPHLTRLLAQVRTFSQYWHMPVVVFFM